MTPNKVCIVGGGVWLRNLCKAWIDSGNHPLELNLVANRFERLQFIATDLNAFVKQHNGNIHIHAHASIKTAAIDAQAVILLLRVGGQEARQRDELLAARFSQVGDEGLGLGGASNAWRTIPALDPIINTIEAIAPKANILNMVAPLGLTTRRLLDRGLDALGICELPLVTAQKLGGPSGLHYAGLNHLGWFWGKDPAGQNTLKQAAQKGLVDPSTLAHFGAAPLHYYYEVVDRAAGRRLGRVRKPGRGSELAAMVEDAFKRIQNTPGAPLPQLEQRKTPWFSDALVPVLQGVLGVKACFNVVNRQNNPPIFSWLPDSAIVETFTHFGSPDASPKEKIEPTSRPPEAVVSFLQGLANYEEALYHAACQQDLTLLAAALQLGPWALKPEEASRAAYRISQPASAAT